MRDRREWEEQNPSKTGTTEIMPWNPSFDVEVMPFQFESPSFGAIANDALDSNNLDYLVSGNLWS